ncbi:ankyrin repeat domain containing protein [Pyrenophora tritici-repentis]|uniref:Ankyrin repeat domain containing protein n=1 Tax=Pyrenophora tritici-repentis TaxID=45151 RepID=A0A2W1GNX7_9PLEO|nr:ankyrin repeat domain containing protein [Pyrenophora tritici-repentis]KAF7567497.1 ankyrin repeat domain containing protein [Pyrenophora tritici-repentis]KAG9382084.1 ankyrin repeat domain containing protein [Pyrenophora tritici-repentis]KAI0576550.1 ankyrin repeat domain-containing protein [Pyrenophora tritici-repentis]KAI0604584.1 ankyrin repeat domain-containing protein [Pyrenophora tritici-repentis]
MSPGAHVSSVFDLYVRDIKLHGQGPIESLFKSLMETLRLILSEVRMQSDIAQPYGSVESSCAALFFWGTDLGLLRGELDDMLQDSPQLRNTCLTVLASISQFASTSLIHLVNSEHRQKRILQSTGISTSLEQTMNMIEQQHRSNYQPKQDVETLCQTLRTKIDTLIMLAPSLASPAEEIYDDDEPRAIQSNEKHLPEQAYANSVSQKFPRAAPAIVVHLGKLNWDRYNHMLRLQRETIQQENQVTALEKARTIFHDSGLGFSLPAQSEVGLNIAVDTSRPESVYAPSMVSSRAEASHKRVPSLPAQARSGDPFTCEICNKQVRFQRTKAWKKHIFDDILAYACFFVECYDTRVFFENSEALMIHLQDHHGMDVRVSDVTCPLCVEFTTGDRDVLSLHVARHMEEIALAILPCSVDSDEESADNSTSDATSIKDDNILQTRQDECPEDPNDREYPGSPILPYHDPMTGKLGVPFEMQAASYRGHEQVVKMLLDAGADINAQGGNHGNALQAASLRGHKQVVKMLLDKGVDINAQSGNHGNALQAASEGGHKQVVKMLLDNGADINAQGGEYGNALQAASARGHEQVVKTLLDNGADINAQGGYFGNALQAASLRGHEQVVKMLLDNGADINAQSGNHGNALQAASEGGHK